MLYVITVHYKDDRWIQLQRQKLEQHISEPFRLHACLEGISQEYDKKFDRVVPAIGAHPGKLNLLAADICVDAADSDLLMFLDGDAFPVADPMPLVYSALEDHDMVAVRRSENLGDAQPHPMFCVTTAGFWRRLPGDWSAGYPWRNDRGDMVTDVGGNLILLTERKGASWLPVERSLSLSTHPLAFGVYGDIIYHQGAGFRRMIMRVDRTEAPRYRSSKNRVVRGIQLLRQYRWLNRRMKKTESAGKAIYAQLTSDPYFVERLISERKSDALAAKPSPAM